MESTLKRTWAEIDLDHLTHNFEVIRRRVGDKVKLLGVVKADGYGHGAVEIAKRYETQEVVSFINGILGSFVRAEFADTPPKPEKADDSQPKAED